MIKILFQIKDNKLLVQIRKRLNSDQKNIINTNVISQNELVFSDEYIASNLKLMHNFIKEITINYNINTLIIKEFSIAPLILSITSNISNLVSLYLLEESILNYNICEKIIKTNTIKFVSLYNIPTFLLEMLDREKITVESRNEILFLSNFMKENNLNNFSSLYYATSIYLDFPFSKEDEEDFAAFININKYLKTIYINNVNKNDIEFILDILHKQKLKNIKILIEQNVNNYDLIEYLKKLNKKNAKTNGIKFMIDYSKDYLEDNLMNQIHLNTIKSCIFIALFLVSSIVFYVFYSNYTSMQKDNIIKEDINKFLSSYEEKNNDEIIIDDPEIPDNNTPDIEDDENNENSEENNQTPEENKTETTKPKIMRDDIKGLLEINENTVGWLKVNNTNIDYPVVQAEDNDFYLNHNFKKQKDNNGWIFMDYRADPKNLNKNMIIFGHNMYYSGVMFGTLYKAKSANWYKNPENQIIEFDTLYEKLKWKIFSIYVVPNTNDYLIAYFSSDEKFQEYLNMVTDRSIYTFNTPVSVEDNIITLSTCANNGKNRLVIHAVLLND